MGDEKPEWNIYMDNRYSYTAKVKAVYDADTITCNINLGFYVKLRDQKIRLYGINAPEVRGPQKKKGFVSRDALREWILGKTITLYSVMNPKSKSRSEEEKVKKGKYGRWLGILIYANENLNEKLVTDGIAQFSNCPR